MASKGSKGTQRKLTVILCADVTGYQSAAEWGVPKRPFTPVTMA